MARLSGHLERVRQRIDEILQLDSDQLIAAVAGRETTGLRRELGRFDPARARADAAGRGIELLCRCDNAYPASLRALPSPPAVIQIVGGIGRLGELLAADPVAIVGARRASPYGLDVARMLGRGLAAAGVTVVSGMALGIDSAAHTGALSAGAATLAVLPAGPDRAYPRAKRVLHQQIRATGAVVSELPSGTAIRRWMFPARNRIIAGLARMTVVVEASEHSGALLTAAHARELDRPIAAVPGRVTSVHSAGPNALLAAGACLVRGPQDVLDRLFGDGVRRSPRPIRPTLSEELDAVLTAIGEGWDTAAALERQGFAPDQGLAALGQLELAGYVRREPGGRFLVIP
jgi:DNA processing protein